MITIEPYKAEWRIEFQTLGQHLRQTLGDLALRIDHIGSTSVPKLAAKDIIDIQITVQELDSAVETALNRAGYQRVTRITHDHIPPDGSADPQDWVKWIFNPASTHRPVNVHIRLSGRANQRYALLFRDYLRAFSLIAEAYARVKIALITHHPEEDMAVYYDVKDPVCDIIVGGAKIWVEASQWEIGPTDC